MKVKWVNSLFVKRLVYEWMFGPFSSLGWDTFFDYLHETYHLKIEGDDIIFDSEEDYFLFLMRWL